MKSLPRACAALLILFGWSNMTPAQDAPTPVQEQPANGSAAAQPTAAEAADAERRRADDRREQTERFVRISKTEDGKLKALETSIVRYVGPEGSHHEGVVVDLVGVVHIGQQEYYDQLDELLSKYDVVLYELVAPDGTRVRPEDLENRNCTSLFPLNNPKIRGKFLLICPMTPS